MKRLAARRPRFGYRRIQVLMDREGYPMSFDRAYRLWRKAALQVPKKRPRRRLAIGIPDRLRILLEFGADPTVRNANGQTPLDKATREGKTDSAEVLRNAMQRQL